MTQKLQKFQKKKKKKNHELLEGFTTFYIFLNDIWGNYKALVPLLTR